MKLSFFIPGLTWLDRDNGAELCKDLALPALSMLLGRGVADLQAEPVTASHVLCQALSIDTPVIAANLAQAAGLPSAPGWLLADPVNLRVDRDRALLGDVGIMNLAQAEADALIASLNDFFAEDGLRFYAPTPDRWFIALPAPTGAQFSPLPDVIGEDINHHLPKGGKQGMLWSRYLNELQMLLYSHPVNDAREQRGEPTVNSLWFWGESAAPAALRTRVAQLWSHDPLWQTLAALAGAKADSPPFAFALPEGGEDTLVVLDMAEAAAQFRDVWGWREALKRLDADWLVPALDALRVGKITELHIYCHGTAAWDVRITRADLWKIWRRPRPLTHLYQS